MFLRYFQCVCVGAVVSDSLQPSGLQPVRLPCTYNFPSKNTAAGCHVLLQEIFLPRDRTCIPCVFCIGRQVLYQLSHQGSPIFSIAIYMMYYQFEEYMAHGPYFIAHKLQHMISRAYDPKYFKIIISIADCCSPSNLINLAGNPLQCSCLENPRDGGAWWAAIYGVTQSRTRLK